MATRRAVSVVSENTTYLVERGKERLRVTVPSSWKVTFGPMVPGERGFSGNATCLRFYEAKDQQRAIFTNVTAFRDTSIPVEKMVERVEERSQSKRDHKSASSTAELTRDESWITAD